jgi:hypothetical protein
MSWQEEWCPWATFEQTWIKFAYTDEAGDNGLLGNRR